MNLGLALSLGGRRGCLAGAGIGRVWIETGGFSHRIAKGHLILGLRLLGWRCRGGGRIHLRGHRRRGRFGLYLAQHALGELADQFAVAPG